MSEYGSMQVSEGMLIRQMHQNSDLSKQFWCVYVYIFLFVCLFC